MDDDVVALCEALREIDEGRVVSPTWLNARYPDRGTAVVEALLLESLVASGTDVPARLGPFRVIRELGRGGMGVVYLAEDDRPAAADARIAVKVLHARLAARPEAVQAILREATLGRQVRHDHVVPVLDAGTCMVGGRPSVYVAMAYVDGPPASSRLREGGPVPEPLCLRIACDVARGLVALHARGIVHRDVKPSNILLSPAGRALLADLGVATLRSELACVTDRPAFSGTLPYAAPEQIAGAELDGRADLYALGVTLHELATGVACEGARDVRLRGRRFSRFFEELLRKLLAPRREVRFDSAAALLEAVEGGEASRWWSRRVTAIRAGGSLAAVRRRRGPRLHGRGDEMARLHDALEAAKGGEGRAVLLVGEAGIGKSRLLEEFLGEAARRDEAFRLWRCAFPPVRDPGGTLPLEQSARQLVATTDLAQETGALAPVATAYVSLAEVLAAELPLVAVFDDVQFASAEEQAVVAALAAAARGRSLLVVALSREPAPPVLPEDGVRIALVRLPNDAAQQLVREAMGTQASPDLVARVAARSGGNPFFALSLARTTGLSRAGRGKTKRLPRTQLPAAIRRLISERLSRLAARERELLEVAACYGQRIEPKVVARALLIPVPEVARRLASIAEKRGLLQREGTGFVFDHHLVLEALVREIPARRRRDYHAALAAALEGTLRAPPPGDAAVVLCRLYLEGNRGADTLRHLDRALDALAAGHEHTAAFQLCERVLNIPRLAGGAQRLDLLLRAATHGHALGRDEDVNSLLDEALRNAIERGDVAARGRVLVQSAARLVATGRYEEALKVLADAERLTGDPRIDLLGGRALGALGRPDEARVRLERAIARGRASGDVRLEARATVVLSDVLASRARLAEARRGFETALPLCRAAGDPEGEAEALQGLSNAHFGAGDYVRAEEVARTQLDLHRRVADRRGEGRARNTIGNCRLNRGDIAGARVQHERALALAAETGDLDGQAALTGNLGYLRFLEGRLADSLPWCERSISLFERIGRPRGQAIGLYSTGITYTRLGMAETARVRLEASVAFTRRHRIRLGESSALAALADVHALESADDTVLARHEEALAMRREAGPDANASDHLLAIGQLLLRRGEVERARPYLEQARSGAASVEAALVATACCALLPGADVRAAAERVLALEPRAPVYDRMAARFSLWCATGEIGHLAESYRLLLHLREHAPPEARESILTRVPLHRDIVAAWARGGAAD